MKNGKEHEWAINVVYRLISSASPRSENAFIVKSKSFLGAIQKATKLINELGTTKSGDSHWYIKSAWWLEPSSNEDDRKERDREPTEPPQPKV